MLWNWNTVDACFLSSQWHITSDAMFAGSCIGVVLLVVVLEMLRRATKEFDAYLVRRHAPRTKNAALRSGDSSGESTPRSKTGYGDPDAAVSAAAVARVFRPNILEQAVRAALHMLQFAVAYIIMLLAMYFNGYIIISIFVGAYVGFFAFQWGTLGCDPQGAGADGNPTVCCG